MLIVEHSLELPSGQHVKLTVRDIADAGSEGRSYTFELNGGERFQFALRHPSYAEHVAEEITVRLVFGALDPADTWTDAEAISILLAAGIRMGSKARPR